MPPPAESRPGLSPWVPFIIFSGAFLIFWNQFLAPKIWPPVAPKEVKIAEPALALFGGIASTTKPLDDYVHSAEARQHLVELIGSKGLPAKDPVVAAVEPKKVEPKKPSAPAELLTLGGEGSYLKVLLNSKGGSVQQVVLPQFDAADREGLLEKNPDGSKRPLHLIPGVTRTRTTKISEQASEPWPEIGAGKISPEVEAVLSPQSYVMTLYDSPDDDRPLDTLAEAVWAASRTSEDGRDVVTFTAEVGAPHHVTVRKIFSLHPKEYHVGLRVVEIERKAGQHGKPLRYQLSGPVGMPIEGEWYTPTHRAALIGWTDNKGRHARDIETPQEVSQMAGGDKHTASNREFRYGGVQTQFFASMIAVDNQQPETNPNGKASTAFIEAARSTPVGPKDDKHPFLDDLTVRAISGKFDLKTPVQHQFLLYQGPVKVRLLKKLTGDASVDKGLVDRYMDDLSLKTMTDSPMPNWIGSFANAIWWTDLVILFTNTIHTLLGWLSTFIPNTGVCIIVITVMVRGLLLPLSRRQAASAAVMQAKMAKLAPEFKKLQEKHGTNYSELQQAKTRLMLANGVNPFSQLGGCLLLLLQMPVFMGLYYALQESVFFRLEEFLWIPNLAAPDMAVRWGEGMSMVTAPDAIGGFLYLGPYLNVLPLIAVALMLYQQTKMMPTPVDDQQRQQQTMMKFMMIFFALLFYKVAAGLCIYFICSTLWGLAERKLLPKKEVKLDGAPIVTPGGPKPASISRSGGKPAKKPVAPEPAKGGFRSWLEKKMEEAKKK